MAGCHSFMWSKMVPGKAVAVDFSPSCSTLHRIPLIFSTLSNSVISISIVVLRAASGCWYSFLVPSRVSGELPLELLFGHNKIFTRANVWIGDKANNRS